MSDLPRTGAGTTQAAITATLNTETAGANTAPISQPSSGSTVVVFGSMQFTTGTGVTAVTPRIRRGVGIAGALVGLATAIAAAASTTIVLDVMVVDTLVLSDAIQYTVTVQQTGATGNGSIVQSSILALVLG